MKTAFRRAALAGAAVVAAGAIVSPGIPGSRTPMRDFVRDKVPAARDLMGDPTNRAFEIMAGGGLQTRASPADGADSGPALTVRLPAKSTGGFEVHERGGHRAVVVSLKGARAVAPTAEEKAVVYQEAYDHLDVVALAGGDRFELLYVARDLPTPPLDLHVDVSPRDSWHVEPTTHALVLRDDRGRPKLRLSEPLAVDAHGQHRRGTYAVVNGGADVRVVLDTEGLTAPLVIDPTFTLPFWSILSDARVPAAETNDPTLLSREWHVTFDSVRDRTVLVRPVRPQLDVDTMFITGDAANPLNGARTILPTPRTHLAPPVPGANALADWSRGYDLESETWEWNGTAWTLNETARLPGLVDPALAFDAGRGVTVLYGGAPPGGWACAVNGAAAQCGFSSLFEDRTATYEYDGASWTTKRIPGAPPPRVRASMAWSSASSQVLLFGGRASGPPSPGSGTGGPATVLVSPNGPPFPESLASTVLNDTWTYDGAVWTPLATGSSPPALEGAQLIYDVSRNVFVMVGGHSVDEVAPAVDRLGIWEFDGTDWSQKLVPADPNQPASIRTRYGATAFYNPTRQRVTIFGGTVGKLDFCTLSDTTVAGQLSAAQGNSVALTALQATGCLGGYVHDSWEWDGSTLTKVADVVFGGTTGPTQQPVFEQVAGATSWAAAGASPGGEGGVAATHAATELLSYRYDRTGSHFVPRTQLERAHYPDGGVAMPEPVDMGTEQATTGVAVSPVFDARLHADAVFDVGRGVATVFVPDTAAIVDTDGASWTVRTPAATPFARGPNDFLATAWDPANQRIVAFDPRDGSTWSYTDGGGWALVATVGPPAWGLDPAFHSKRDFVRSALEKSTGTEAASFAPVLGLIPKMTFDRGRARAVMLYKGATWEFDGATWTSAPPPPTWTQCTAATLLAFDGARAATVAFGCNVPADTWEWNGAQWTGPGPSPFTAMVARTFLGLTLFQQDLPQFGILYPNWTAPLQLGWAHPNAAFESPSLGGVSVADADGTVRTWNGTAWIAGAQIPTQAMCFSSLWDPSQAPAGSQVAASETENAPVVQNDIYWLGREFLPSCVMPPMIEDAANNRLLAFRDGPLGMLELQLGTPPAQRAWEFVRLGTEGFLPNSTAASGTSVQPNPYPFELMAPETVHLLTQSAPAARLGQAGTGFTLATVPERVVEELWWPYRVFVDPATQTVRFMTDRGAVWQLSGENIHGLGDPCASDSDCGQGFCGTEGVCCDLGTLCTQTPCQTCKGATPGVCGPAVKGQADASGFCGTGPCTGTCPGPGMPLGCAYDATVTCGPPSVCTQGAVTPGGHCGPQSPVCITSTTLLPTCPVANGVPDVSSPCVLPPQACAGGAACASTAACGTGCVLRTDCASPYSDCSTLTGTCGPDVASQLATQQGISPATVHPPPRLTNAEIAGMLDDAGVAHDDSGVYYLGSLDPNAAVGGAFDPSLVTPALSMRNCMQYIETCAFLNGGDIDGCVAQAPRCATSTPWTGDPAGVDCCPQSCLVQYLTTRASNSPGSALVSLAQSACILPADAGSTTDGGAQ